MGLLDSTTQQAYYQGNSHGNYQFTSLTDIINQFMVVYVGEDKLISKIKRVDVAFHAQRALQELSFDTFKSTKAQEITLPPSLQMTLPQDYVNYTKVSWVDSAGIKHLLYPTSKTSNPSNPFQNSDGGFKITTLADLTVDSEFIVLNKQYDNILVGMVVKGLGVPDNTTVLATSTLNGVTTITLSADILLSASGSVTDATITFEPFNGTLIQEPDFQISQYHAGYTVSSTEITFFDGSQIDMKAAGVKIGMLISSEDFPVGTTVVDVSGTNVVFASNGATASSGLYNKSIVFTSPNSKSDTWSSYKSATPSDNQDDYQDDTYWPMDGSRYGLDPQHAQANGSFYIDDQSGKIHFSSNVSGKTVILDYISDSLGTDGEMQVHKFAEEAMYKWISHAILSGRANVPEYQVNRFKKERFAAIRTAKLRLSNIKLEEITQILRGKSKQIKH